MTHILAVGIATIDIINQVECYPAENDEVRVTSQQKLRGGNATNTLVVLSQLGHQTDWAGVLINEPDVTIVEQDLQQFGVNYQHCTRFAHGKMPTSYICLSQSTGSRTIVHHRDCPEYDYAAFKQLDLSQYDWVHFEGRNIADLELMLMWLKRHYPQLKCSLEVEKPRDGIEMLFNHVDVLLFSQHYVESKGYASAITFLEQLTTPAMASCTWGEAGAWLKVDEMLYHSPAFPPAQVVDTLGAGDTYNAGFISALLNQSAPQLILEQACRLAGHKCGHFGFTNLSKTS